MPNGRCYYHGGGNVRGAGAALVWRPGLEAAWKAKGPWLEWLHSFGLKHPGGRPSGRWWRVKKGTRERLVLHMDDLIETLPAVAEDRPVEQWSHTELLDDAARMGLIRLRELLKTRITRKLDLKEKRLIAEMALGAAKLLGNLQVAKFQAGEAGEQRYRDMLRTIAEIQAKGRPK